MHLPKFRLRRPRYADVVATFALLFALGGTAYAAATVHTADIADGAVTTPKIADGAIGPGRLADGAVRSVALADGAVTNFKLASGSVTHSKLGTDVIDGSNVASNSLSLADLLGANVTGAISFSLGANTCGNLSLGVSGAQVGQVALMSATGNTAVPGSVVFGFARVTAANTIVVRACNVSASSMSVSGLGVRVVTFG